ncbi:MAG TPA: elongation factor G-like protein EF-G2 [Mycobacteriales bacterium]|nr:elongation factor G-like protein EF-G2 [Mycobacteriales bacterium]
MDEPLEVRNVVLIGHSGAGKTTLVEALLAHAGAIPRPGRVEEGTTVTDHEEIEHRQQRSVGLALASLVHDGVKVNLLDAPGYADFVGDLRAGLRAADAALFVVSAVAGVDAGTRLLWEECAAVQMPRAVVVTRLDQARADFEGTVAVCQQAFGEGVVALYLPLHHDPTDAGNGVFEIRPFGATDQPAAVADPEEAGVGGLIGLLSEQVYDYSGEEREQRPAEPEHLPLIADARAALIEQVIAESEDETLLERYLAGEQIELKVLIDDLETAVARATLFPVLGASGLTGLGAGEILEVLVSAFPRPAEHQLPAVTTPTGDPAPPLTADPAGPLVAEVVKTATDPYVGRISLVRVFSGTLRPDTLLHVCGHGPADRPDAPEHTHDVDERAGHLAAPLGATLRPRESCPAGDICAVARLARAETGDTLSDPATPLLIEPWVLPPPLLPVADEAASRADEDKLGQALARVTAEDPTVRLERVSETHQTVLWTLGEAHVEVLLHRLAARHHVTVRTVPMRVPMRETFIAPGRGHGRHVKQSGGHGQYAVCDVEVTALGAGEGFRFVDKIVGGAVPHAFIASVEKGVRAQLDKGLLAGYPVVDVEVALVDGKTHPVDSSDQAFQIAGALALQDAATDRMGLLEPYSSVVALVPDDYVGAVLGDLAGRRGRVQGTAPGELSGWTEVAADVPDTELLRYAIDLRSLSHGTGSFRREHVGYEPMPLALAAKVPAR